MRVLAPNSLRRTYSIRRPLRQRIPRIFRLLAAPFTEIVEDIARARPLTS